MFEHHLSYLAFTLFLGVMTFFGVDRLRSRLPTIRSLCFLLLATVLFYWRILLTRQFSLLTDPESVTQAYSWFAFWTASLHHGVLPLWDPYTLAGHTFAGEMQTAAFYPLHLILVLFTSGSSGFSPNLYHLWFAFTHFLGACFMFALVRELGLGRFAAFVSGLCFSLGGFVGHIPWPHMLESSIWMPLLFLFFLRALRREESRLAMLNSALAGLILGMAILAGGIHVVIMQVLTIVSAAAYHVFTANSKESGRLGLLRQHLLRAAMVVAIIGAVSACAGAIQLLPSIEYSNQSIRFLGKPGALPANEKIPYAELNDGLWPDSFVAMLIPQAFNGIRGSGEAVSPYLGVFPLLLAVIGIWKNWGHRWVRYLAGLALVAFLYSLASFSPLHGLLYALVPRLWIAREAGRMVYLTDFSLSILAAFGLETLSSSAFRPAVPAGLDRSLKGLVIACAAGLFVPAVFGRPEIDPWIQLSLLLIFVSYGLFRYIIRGSAAIMARLLVVSLILFDLAAFDWSARNIRDVAKTGTNHLDRLLSCRGAADFLRSRQGEFRVEIAADPAPNIGDFYGVQTTSSAGVTLPVDFPKIVTHPDLLNVFYRLAPASIQAPGAIYSDPAWKIYQKPNVLPRAWVVHEAIVAPSPELAFAELEKPGFDPRRTATLDVGVALEPLVSGTSDDVAVRTVKPGRVEIDVRPSSRGMLVLSEMFYPGWRAAINGRSTRIYRADSALRGILVPAGKSHIILEYAPRSVYVGAWLTFVTFFVVLAACAVYRASSRPA